MSALFRVREVLQLTDRGPVLAGDILAGEVRAGMQITMPERTEGLTIKTVESVLWSAETGASSFGLMFVNPPGSGELKHAFPPGAEVAVS